MRITLKTFILVALIIFNLVIIISNFTTYEGLESNSASDSDDAREKEKIEEFVDEDDEDVIQKS